MFYANILSHMTIWLFYGHHSKFIAKEINMMYDGTAYTIKVSSKVDVN
jgi:hypothetical protein